MSWMTKLYDTYNKVVDDKSLPDHPDPYFHIKEGCHIEIIIDDKGCFKSAQSLVTEKQYGKKTVYKKTNTVIPITPKSLTGRTSGPAPYPLTEKIQYVAKDYVDYGGTKAPYFTNYMDELKNWANHEQYSHWKVKAVFKYVTKGTVIKDLVEAGLLFVTKNGDTPILITKWKEQAEKGKKKPPLIQSVIGGEQGNAIIRWKVQREGEANDTTWADDELIGAWQSYASLTQKKNGFCQILGQKAFITQTHPKAIYYQAINAKLISTPTDKGYLTYQGRFTDDSQPVGISFEVSQKSHNTLRWLIERGQGKTIGESKEKKRPAVIVCWAISGADIPQPMEDTWDLLSYEVQEISLPLPVVENKIDHTIDLGQSFSIALGKLISGYHARLNKTDNIVIMGLDSATDGRMSVTYYQEFFPEEYFERIGRWHEEFSWPQRYNFKKDEESQDGKSPFEFPSAPSPRAIWEAAYGKQITDSLKKSTVERILPCIVEARLFPRDLVDKAVQRAGNRSLKRLSDQYSNRKNENAAWERDLSVACALFRGFSKRNPIQIKEYEMALEENITTRDYLYGRLLAIAEKIEEMAMVVAEEKVRATHASRLMQRFSDHPASTWLIIEKGINPYQQRLKNNIPPLESAYKRLLDDVCDAFENDDFVSHDKLLPEYLLGYHCQRKWLRDHKLKEGKWVLKENNEDDEFQTEGEEE